MNEIDTMTQLTTAKSSACSKQELKAFSATRRSSVKEASPGTKESPRKKRTTRTKKKAVTYFGDHDFAIDNALLEGVATNLMLVNEDLASWNEIWHTCCFHSEREWLQNFAAIVALSFFLYFFFFGLHLLSVGSRVMGGCASGELFGRDVRKLKTRRTP
jgi:hypothetical protein